MNLQEVFHDKKHTGFSLVELLIVIALILSIGTLVFPFGLSFYQAQMLFESKDGIASALQKAQALAVSGRHNSDHGVKLFSSSYVLFEGLSYEERNSTQDEVFLISSSVEVSGVDEIVFSVFSGLPSTTTKLTLMTEQRETYIEILASGVIQH